MSPRPDVSKTRKRQILEAALRVFSKRGFHKAPMDEIAEEAHLSKGALYWYFKSKDAIMQALADEMFRPVMRDTLRIVADHTLPVPERLRLLARAAANNLDTFRNAMPIIHEFYALATRPGPLRTVFQGYYRRYKEAMSTLIAEGITRGELRPIDPDLAAILPIVQFEGLLLLWVISPQDFDLPTYWEPMAEHFIQSLLPD